MGSFAGGELLVVAGLLLVLPTMVRSLRDARRGWQLRWGRSSDVRRDLVVSLRTGRPAATPARARDVLAYVAIKRRELAVFHSDVYRLAEVLFTLNGCLWLVDGVQLGSPALVLCALVLVTYPLWTRLCTSALTKRLDRAESGNLALAHRPDLYLVRPVGVDAIRS